MQYRRDDLLDAVLCGLATNPSLPAELVDVLIRDGDEEILTDLVERTDLTKAQTSALVARCDPQMIVLSWFGTGSPKPSRGTSTIPPSQSS